MQGFIEVSVVRENREGCLDCRAFNLAEIGGRQRVLVADRGSSERISARDVAEIDLTEYADSAGSEWGVTMVLTPEARERVLSLSRKEASPLLFTAAAELPLDVLPPGSPYLASGTFLFFLPRRELLSQFEALVKPSYASSEYLDEERRREICRRLYSADRDKLAGCLGRIDEDALNERRHARFQEIMSRVDSGELTIDEALDELEELEGAE